MVLAPQLLPSVDWLLALVVAQQRQEPVCLALSLPYRKQQGLNHYRIKGPNQVQTLVAHVQHRSWEQPVAQAELSFAEPWPRHHIRSLTTAYRNAPFWQEYAAPYLAVLAEPPAALWPLQERLLQLACQDLDLPMPQPDASLATADALPELPALPYYQLHGAFAANLSVFDLLVHEGPRTPLVLAKLAAGVGATGG